MEPEANEKNEIPQYIELKLPDWINSNHTEEEKGKLLYIEDWAQKRSFKFDHSTRPSLFFILLGIGIILLGNELESGAAVGVFMLIGLLFIFFALTPLISILTIMPLAIYEKGLSMVWVPLSLGIRRKEVFVPWDRIDRVELGHHGFGSSITRDLKIIILDSTKEAPIRKQVLDYRVLSHPFTAMKLMIRYIPEKMESMCYTYFRGEEGWDVVEELNSKGKNDVETMRGKRNLRFMIAILFLNVVLCIIFLPYTSPVRSADIPNHLFSLILLILLTFSFSALLSGIRIDRKIQEKLIAYRSEFTPEGIHFPFTQLHSLIHAEDTTIPWEEIRSVRTELDPHDYHHVAELETIRESRFTVPFTVYSEMEYNPDFIERDYEYHNEYFTRDHTINQSSYPGKVSASNLQPKERWNIPGILAFSGILVSPFLFLILLEPAFDGFMNSNPLFFLLLFFGITIFGFFRERLGILFPTMAGGMGPDPKITSEKINFYDMYGGSTSILRNDIREIDLIRGFFGNRVVIRSSSGRYDLNLSHLPVLMNSGYSVRGVLPGPLSTSPQTPARSLLASSFSPPPPSALHSPPLSPPQPPSGLPQPSPFTQLPTPTSLKPAAPLDPQLSAPPPPLPHSRPFSSLLPSESAPKLKSPLMPESKAILSHDPDESSLINDICDISDRSDISDISDRSDISDIFDQSDISNLSGIPDPFTPSQGSAIPIPVSLDRGKVLFQEPESMLKKEKKGNILCAGLSLILSVIFLPLSFYWIFRANGSDISNASVPFSCGFGLLMIGMIFLLMQTNENRLPSMSMACSLADPRYGLRMCSFPMVHFLPRSGPPPLISKVRSYS